MTILGTAIEGFEIESNKISKHINLRLWGFWKIGTANSFKDEMNRAFSSSVGSRWTLMVDATAFKAQSSSVFSIILEVMKKMNSNRTVDMAVIVYDSLTRLQFKRLYQQSGADHWTLHKRVKDAQCTLSNANMK